MTVRYLHAEQYLHAEAVLRAFAAAGKRHLLLTGGRGTGKSTLAGALAGMLGASAGITTTAVPRSCVMMRDNRSGVSAIVGKYDPDLPGNERKMTAVPGGFAEFGAALLRRCAEMDDEWISVDEIGYLEHGCTAYSDALAALMEKKRLLAVVRKQALPDCSALTRREDVFLLDLDQPFGADAVGCVIMASGMGVRFGGNKLMADFRGMPMIGRVLDCTEGIFTRRVVVTRHSTVADFCAQRGVDTVLHDLPDRSDSLLAAMALACADKTAVTAAQLQAAGLQAAGARTVLGTVTAESNTQRFLWDCAGPALYRTILRAQGAPSGKQPDFALLRKQLTLTGGEPA